MACIFRKLLKRLLKTWLISHLLACMVRHKRLGLQDLGLISNINRNKIEALLSLVNLFLKFVLLVAFRYFYF